MMPLGLTHSITYYKRFKMERDLANVPLVPTLPDGYAWVPWQSSLLEAHSEALYGSFQDEIDALVFPSLGSRRGCQHLMGEICRKPGFLPRATWLIACAGSFCGTVQGIGDRGVGAIQNLGITAAHRGKGLGRALLLQALDGFRRAGLGKALLEVTARNDGAVRLYQRAGFRKRKTIYKAVEILPAALTLASEP